jgi:hypothetical protein
MSEELDFPRPKFVTGGCLCGSIRYRVEFNKDHDFTKSVSADLFALADIT